MHHPPSAFDSTEHRGDIDGLRAIAVVLVIAFHAGIERIGSHLGTGLFGGGFVGVDVFFVISGFLITGLLIRDLRNRQRIDFARFYMRRARRLLPLATVVVISVLMASMFLVPPIDRPEVAGDGLFATFYLANVHFAANATQYMALMDLKESPLLHYWSLGAEEQFYFIWPSLLMLSQLRRREFAQVRTRTMVGAITLISLGISIWYTPRSGPWAFFSLHTRAWELGVGGLLALYQEELRRVAARGSSLMGWMGLALIAGAFVFFTRETPFPGRWALVPVAGSALIIVAGLAPLRGPLSRTLAIAPAQYVGRISYSWYLWHWPCIVFSVPWVGAVRRPDAPTLLMAIAASLILAIASHHLIEDPARRAPALSRPAGALGLVAASMASVLLGASALSAMGHRSSDASLRVARGDEAPGTESCIQDYTGTRAVSCSFGVPDAPIRLVLIGDSHAQHMVPALDVVARSRGWGALLFSKQACPPFEVRRWLSTHRREYTECAKWQTNVAAALSRTPGLTIVLSRFGGYDDFLGEDGKLIDSTAIAALWEAGARRSLEVWAGLSDKVIVMRDVPFPRFDVPACISGKGAEACRFETRTAVHWDDALYAAEVRAANGDERVTFVDLSDEICPKARLCPVITLEGTIKYRDADHLTSAYSATLGEPLLRLLP